MQHWHKFISSAVLATVIMLPLLPLAMCVPETSPAGMHCPPGCPMMANSTATQPTTELKQGDRGSCCTIQSSKPAPVTESQVVQPVVSSEPVAEPMSFVVRAAHQRTAGLEASSPPLLDLQARLCTFQI